MIGIFDSGSGGLTVLRELRRRAPQADIVYFGDLKNAPYGNKSREELGVLTVLGIQKLIDEGATEIISACNSVSVSIVLPMFEILQLPYTNIIEMVGPTVSSFRGSSARVLVAATRATIESGVYQDGFRMLGIEATGVAIPELVRHIEEGAPDLALAHTVREALAPYAQERHTHVLFGCTHYPLIVPIFADVLRELEMNVALVDPAVPVTQAVLARYDTDGSGSIRLLSSQASAVFDRYAQYALEDAAMTLTSTSLTTP